MRPATWNLQRLTRATSVRMSRVRPWVDGPHLDLSPVRMRDRLEDYDFNRNEAEHERG